MPVPAEFAQFLEEAGTAITQIVRDELTGNCNVARRLRRAGLFRSRFRSPPSLRNVENVERVPAARALAGRKENRLRWAPGHSMLPAALRECCRVAGMDFRQRKQKTPERA